MKNLTNWTWYAWVVAFVATAGSLYASEVAGWDPCILCWYQRIFMYPLAVILLVAALNKDCKVWKYALPLATIGASIALYHNLLRWGVISATCPATGPSCLQGEGWFGFITLPLLSLVAFLLIIAVFLKVRSEKS